MAKKLQVSDRKKTLVRNEVEAIYTHAFSDTLYNVRRILELRKPPYNKDAEIEMGDVAFIYGLLEVMPHRADLNLEVLSSRSMSKLIITAAKNTGNSVSNLIRRIKRRLNNPETSECCVTDEIMNILNNIGLQYIGVNTLYRKYGFSDDAVVIANTKAINSLDFKMHKLYNLLKSTKVMKILYEIAKSDSYKNYRTLCQIFNCYPAASYYYAEELKSDEGI